MAIRFTCSCGKSYRAADNLAGKQVKCRACGEISHLPDSRGETGDSSECPVCGERNPTAADSCTACGSTLRVSTTATATAREGAYSLYSRTLGCRSGWLFFWVAPWGHAI